MNTHPLIGCVGCAPLCLLLARRVLDGLDWVSKARVGGRLRLPCTLDVLVRVLAAKAQLEGEMEAKDRPSVYSMGNFASAAAVYSMAFCGAFRPSEISVRDNQAKGYVSHPLCLKDVTVDRGQDGQPIRMIVWLPQRKNDQLGKKSDVVIGVTGHPVRASSDLHVYAIRSTADLPGDMFMLRKGNDCCRLSARLCEWRTTWTPGARRVKCFPPSLCSSRWTRPRARGWDSRTRC